MSINIISLPGLHRVLEVDGLILSNLSDLYIDEFVYNSRPGRYRFTLAHEIGHIVLHKNICAKAIFGNIQAWKTFINSISEKDHSWLEYHAYTFGGLVLAPKEHLVKHTQHYINYILNEGIALKGNWDFAWDRIADQSAKDFEVSTQVIKKRLNKDKIMDRYL